jgi:hypothetical protein
VNEKSKISLRRKKVKWAARAGQPYRVNLGGAGRKRFWILDFEWKSLREGEESILHHPKFII